MINLLYEIVKNGPDTLFFQLKGIQLQVKPRCIMKRIYYIIYQCNYFTSIFFTLTCSLP